jgi:3',5'-cyclic AMP phosphodiesterase CpdA
VGARILHVSDLHVGTAEDPQVETALSALVEQTRPELVIASGDLSHRARPEQLDGAARLLRGLGPPVLAVPGNHDIPWGFARLTAPFAEFDRVWGEREPVYASAAVHVVGLNSARPWRQQSGGLRTEQLAAAGERLARAAPGALRVVVLHHQMLGAPWRTRKKPVARRNHVLRSLVEAGAELILAGHVHQAAVGERHEFEVVRGDVQSVVVSIAPGLGQPRPSRVGEARGLHVYDAGERTLTVSTYIWRGRDWGLTARRVFGRGTAPLASEEAGSAAAR